MIASIDERIAEYCRGLIADLDVFTSIRLTEHDPTYVIDNIADLLRGFFRHHRASLNDQQIQSIKECLLRGENGRCAVNRLDGEFVNGHYYFASKKGMFRVVKASPSLEIEQHGSHVLFSSDQKPKLWAGHLRHLTAFVAILDTYERSPPEYLSEVARMRAEIEQETESAKQQVERRHTEFLKARGLAATDVVKTTRVHRVTHCYSCKEALDNAIDLECHVLRMDHLLLWSVRMWL